MKFFIKIILIILVLVGGYILSDKYFKFRSENFLNNEKKSDQENIFLNKKSELNILFTGDIMLDRNIRKIINENRNPENFVNNFLENLSSENKNYDYVVSNLEGPITENNTKTYNKDGSYTGLLTFTFPTSTSKILNLLNIKVVSLANNHTGNFGYQGFKDTLTFLNKGNIDYFGNPYNSLEDELSKVICEKDICIAYIGYHQFTKNNDSERIEKEIQKLKSDKKVDFVVIFPHWGEEYKLESNNLQKEYAHKWIDMGSDLVIGMHPHVIEESEIYKGKYIYYSLGNYIFDQWFSEDVKNGLTVNFKFKKEILDSGEIKKDIEFIKEIKVRSEKIEIRYLEK